MIDSLFSRMTRIVFCEVILKVPSTPETCQGLLVGSEVGEEKEDAPPSPT